MQKIFQKPYLFFFGFIPVFILLSFFKDDNTTVFNLYDTYLEISYLHIQIISSLFFILIGLNYLFLHWINRKPIIWLTITHLFFQILSLILLYTPNFWNWVGRNKKLELIGFENDNSNIVLTFSILFFLLSFFFHFINFSITVFLKQE
jgi:hypothetical protein